MNNFCLIPPETLLSLAVSLALLLLICGTEPQGQGNHKTYKLAQLLSRTKGGSLGRQYHMDFFYCQCHSFVRQAGGDITSQVLGTTTHPPSLPPHSIFFLYVQYCTSCYQYCTSPEITFKPSLIIVVIITYTIFPPVQMFGLLPFPFLSPSPSFPYLFMCLLALLCHLLFQGIRPFWPSIDFCFPLFIHFLA